MGLTGITKPWPWKTPVPGSYCSIDTDELAFKVDKPPPYCRIDGCIQFEYNFHSLYSVSTNSALVALTISGNGGLRKAFKWIPDSDNPFAYLHFIAIAYKKEYV